jgi:hypothetical protein
MTTSFFPGRSGLALDIGRLELKISRPHSSRPIPINRPEAPPIWLVRCRLRTSAKAAPDEQPEAAKLHDGTPNGLLMETQDGN